MQPCFEPSNRAPKGRSNSVYSPKKSGKSDKQSLLGDDLGDDDLYWILTVTNCLWPLKNILGNFFFQIFMEFFFSVVESPYHIEWIFVLFQGSGYFYIFVDKSHVKKGLLSPCQPVNYNKKYSFKLLSQMSQEDNNLCSNKCCDF